MSKKNSDNTQTARIDFIDSIDSVDIVNEELLWAVVSNNSTTGISVICAHTGN